MSKVESCSLNWLIFGCCSVAGRIEQSLRIENPYIFPSWLEVDKDICIFILIPLRKYFPIF